MTRFLRHTQSKDPLFPVSAHILLTEKKNRSFASAQDDKPLLK